MCAKTFLRRSAPWVWAAAFVLYGLGSAKTVQLTLPPECTGPQQLLEVPSVKNPTLDGLISGISLGAYPRIGYGQPTACLDVDAGRGVSPAQWPLMVRATAKTWAFSRGAGFAVSSLVLWWALVWLWRAARLLRWSQIIPRRSSSPKSPT